MYRFIVIIIIKRHTLEIFIQWTDEIIKYKYVITLKLIALLSIIVRVRRLVRKCHLSRRGRLHCNKRGRYNILCYIRIGIL